jgi:leader peptidase (prepilin peptidase)/N-methyltransferase
MAALLVFIFGSIIGSFLNVCIYRLPKNESIVFPASHCPKCRKKILWYDNVPFLSYILLGGKCRSCRAGISFRYFLVETITASVAVLLYSYFALTPKFFAYSVFSFGLIVATFVDFEIQEIPDQISIGGAIVGVVLSLVFPGIMGALSHWGGLLESLKSALIGGGIIYLLGVFGKIAFKKDAMGGGDVKLMAMIGAFLGWKNVLLVFFMAPFFGGIVGLIQKIKDGRNIIPYGPYLSLAAFITIFYGDKILRFFLYGFH